MVDGKPIGAPPQPHAGSCCNKPAGVHHVASDPRWPQDRVRSRAATSRAHLRRASRLPDRGRAAAHHRRRRGARAHASEPRGRAHATSRRSAATATSRRAQARSGVELEDGLVQPKDVARATRCGRGRWELDDHDRARDATARCAACARRSASRSTGLRADEVRTGRARRPARPAQRSAALTTNEKAALDGSSIQRGRGTAIGPRHRSL